MQRRDWGARAYAVRPAASKLAAVGLLAAAVAVGAYLIAAPMLAEARRLEAARDQLQREIARDRRIAAHRVALAAQLENATTEEALNARLIEAPDATQAVAAMRADLEAILAEAGVAAQRTLVRTSKREGRFVEIGLRIETTLDENALHALLVRLEPSATASKRPAARTSGRRPAFRRSSDSLASENAAGTGLSPPTRRYRVDALALRALRGAPQGSEGSAHPRLSVSLDVSGYWREAQRRVISGPMR